MTEAQRGTLPAKLARQIGAAPPLPGEAGPEPQTMMDWALHYSRRGLYVFPCDNYVGNPLMEKWHKAATTNASQIAEFWAPSAEADIACVPDRSGHFVIAVVGKMGLVSLQKIETQYGRLDPAIAVDNRWHNRLLFFSGIALSSCEQLGPGIHVLGAGRYVFLPPSMARIPEELPDDQRGGSRHA